MVKDYKVCAKTKASQHKPYKKFQTLPISKQTWGSVIINFIVKLSKSKDSVNNTSYNNILVIIDRFIKYSKFISANKSHSAKDFIDIVVREIINNYKLLDEFITDKDTTFVFQFFITFIAKLGVNNKLFIAFHL